MGTKTQQLQIRVSPEQKRAIRRRAKRAGQDLSTFVLARVLSEGTSRFAEILHGLDDPSERRFWLAELNDLYGPAWRSQTETESASHLAWLIDGVAMQAASQSLWSFG